MSLTTQEIFNLFDSLEINLASTETFETIANTFHLTFPKAHTFQLCNVIVFMLKHYNEFLPSSSQRLAALFMLYECYKNEEFVNNPFANVFINLLANDNAEEKKVKCHDEFPKLEKKERNFIFQLIFSITPFKELIKLKPKEALELELPENEKFDFNIMLSKLLAKQAELPKTCTAGISVLLDHPNTEKIYQRKAIEGLPFFEEIFKNGTSVLEKYYTPEPIRPIPPIHLDERDFYWEFPQVYPFNHLEFLMDRYMKPDLDEENETEEWMDTKAKELMNKALEKSLPLCEERLLISKITSDPTIVHQANISTVKFPDLVENNPQVAIEVLLALTKSTEISEYISALVNMKLSLHSMEVVNHLAFNVELPSDLMIFYVNQCITACEQTENKFHRHRLVRLVCVFIKSLIRNEVINAQDVFVELQTFCIQYSRYREASALFKFLKNLDSLEKESILTDSN